ncbi:hypothetical protein D3C72_1663130 [compost metagenome]
MLQREGAGEHARAHHHGHEARAFLVGPHRHLDRCFGGDAGVVQAADHFEPREHAVVAVELAARGLRVDVTAGGDGWQRVVAARAAREDVADGVHAHLAAGLARPAREEVAALAVQVGERDAAHAALLGGAELRELHQRVPEALAVHAQGAHVRCGGKFVRCVHDFCDE